LSLIVNTSYTKACHTGVYNSSCIWTPCVVYVIQLMSSVHYCKLISFPKLFIFLFFIFFLLTSLTQLNN